ncbi:MAG: hypothetical protein MJA29_13155, partial [Candidatus Omnitrophica bacterium]|nr:hypothetical protein [Candidatus Omnitrophota bacterium]
MPVRKGLPFFAAALFFSFGLLVLFNRPALAGYRVQRGRTQVVASPTDAGIPDPVDDVNKTWVLITRGTGSMNSNQNADEVCVRGYLLDNDTVRFHRVDTATQSSWVSWQVIEATSGEFEVYRGGGIFGASAGDANISIGATVNSSNCFAWVTADNSQNSRSYYDESELTAYVMNSTHVRIQRDASGSATVNFNWTVVEFSPSKIGSIQTGETVVTTNTSSSPQLQAISPINTSTSILIYQHRTTNNGIVYAGLTGRIDNATSMRFYKHLNFASTNTVRWHVIDFGGNAARQNGTIDNSGTSNWYTLDRTLSPAVDTNSTITFHRMTCSGTSTGSAYPRPFATNLLLNSTSYRIQRMRQGQPTWNEWQLLQLPTGVTIEVNGTVYTNEAKSGNIGEGKNVSISVGGDPVDTVTTNADGQFNFTGILVEPQQVVLVYLDGESEAGSLVTVTDGETPLTGVEALEMYTGKVVLEYQNGTELNNTLLDVIDGVDAGNEDGITVSGSDVTFAEGFEVWIDGGMTYRPEGEVAADAFEVTGAGVFDPAGNQVTVSGNFTVSQTGSFTSSGTVIFDGASPQVLIPGGTDAAHDFQNLEHSGSGVLQLEDAGGLDVDDTLTQSGTGDFDTQGYAVTVSNLTVTGGTFNADADSGTWAVADNLTVSGSGSLTATSGVCNISGSFVNSGTFAHNNGAVIFNATSGSETIDAPAADGAFYDLITEDGGGGATWTLSGDVAVDHDLNVSGGTFAAAGNDITIAGNWTVDSVDGAYTSGTNTVYFDGSATQTLSPGGTDADHDFQNIEHSGAGTLELAPGSDLDADGTLTQSGPSDFDTQGRALTLGALTVTDGTFNAAAGTGAWTVNGAVTVSGSGSLTATSGSFDVKGDFVSSGTFIHNNARVSLSAASGSPSLDVPPSSGAFHDLVLDDAGNGITFSLESDLLVENNVTITNGTLEGNTHNITVRGSWDNNDIFSASGSSVLFTSNLTGNIIESGTSAFFNLQLNNATGGWTIQTDNLTTLGNFTLNDCNLSGGFIVEAGRRIQVNGTFRNLVGGAATDWGSGTTLNLTADGGGSYTVNTNASGSDVYQSLEVGADTDVRIWHSSASAYTVAPSGSLYSMDHADTDGDLYIWGDYHVPANATDYWSYAADFDGTDLTGGNRRQVGVRLADAAQVTVTAGKKLEIKGESGNATTVNRQSTGSYGIDIVNGTLEADRYEFDHINGNGLNISGADATVISLDNGDFDNSTGSGSQDAFITVSGEALDNNGAFVITAVNFDNNGGAADFNVRATGAPVSFWDFDASTGSFDGEANDADPGGDPGNLVWDDSSAASITVSGTAYTDDDEASAVNNANVSLAVNDQFEQSVTTSGVDGTYSFSGVSVSVGDTLTIFFVNESFSGSSVVISESTDATGIPLYQNHVLVRSEPVGSVSIAQMAKYDKDDDADINFDAEDLAVDTLVIDDGAELFIPAGEEFQPLGNLESGTAGVFDLDNRGTFTLVSDEVIRVSGNWTNAGSAVFGPASSVVKFDAPGGARTIDSGGDNFYDLVVDGAASYTLEASLTANNNLTVSAGTLATGTYTVTTTGTLAVSGGTITATGGNIDADGDVAISSGTLTAPGAGNSFTIAGDYLNSGGTFISGGGKVSFDKASGTQTINAGGTGDVNRDFDDLEKTGSGILQLVSTGLEVDGTMTIASGRTVDLNGRSLNLGTLDNSGTLQMTGTETAVSIAAMDTAKGKTLYVGDGNDVAEVHSLKEIGALDYHDLTVNDAAGITDTYRTGAHLHVNGILEVLSGTLDISTNGNSLTVTEAAGINGGSLSATDGNIDANANLTLASGTLSAPTSGQYFRVFGNLSLSGSFTHSSGTLTFDANSSVRSIDTGGNTLYDLVFDDSAGGATWTLNSDLTGHNLTITGGTLDTGSDRAIVLSGNWVNDDIFVSNTGTVTFNNASGIQTLDAGGTADANKDFNHLTKSAGGTLQLNASGLEADGTLTVSSGCSLELNGRNLNAGTLVNSGTVVVQGPEVVNITAHETSAGTVKYVGDGDASPETHTIAGFGSSEYNHLVINDANPTRDSFQASEDVTVDGDMTVDGGTFIAGSHNLGVDGNLSVSSGTLSAPGGGRTLTISGDLGVAASFGHNTGQVVFNNSAGETTLNAPGGGLIFHDLASQTAGKVIRFTAADTFIVNGAFTIDGTSNATRITLNSTTPDTAWNLILNGTHNVQFVNVRDSSASGVAPLPVNPDNSVDMGNNVNWFPLEQVEGDNTIRSGQDRHTFYDGSNFWAFLIDDGGNVVYKKDDDGIDWPSGNTTLAAGDFTSLGIWEDGTHVWCAYTDGGSLLVKNVTIATGAQGSEFEIIEDFMMEWGNVSGVNGTFQTVTTVGDYGNGMVVAASGDYPDNTSNVTIPRIQNAASSSFEIKSQEPCGSNPETLNMRYVVTKTTGAGTVIPGTSIPFEAQTYLSTVTDGKSNGWNGEDQVYQNSYSSPRVAGQVMTYNDSGWSIFWAHGTGGDNNPPDSALLATGKHTGEWSGSRADETIGFLVTNAAHGTINGIAYEIGRTPASVDRIDESNYTHNFSPAFSSAPQVAVVSTVGINGNDGPHAHLVGTTASGIILATEEDQCSDTERAGSSEEVDYLVFESPGGYYGGDVNHVQIIKGSDGYFWVKWENGANDVFTMRSAAAGNESAWDPHYVVKSSTDSASWGHNQIVPANGTVQYFYQEGNTLYVKNFSDPASQGPALTVAVDCAAAGNESVWNETHYFSVVTDDLGIPYVIYQNTSGYIRYNVLNGTDWLSEPVTTSTNGSCSHPALFYDSEYDTVFAFWVEGSTIRYKRSTSQKQGYWGNETVFKSGLDNPRFLNTAYSDNSTIGVLWREGEGSYISYGTLPLASTIVDLVDFFA